MQEPHQIFQPEMWWIQTAPTSLGSVQNYLVLFDKEDFPNAKAISTDEYSMAWFEANQAEIAQDIDDDDFPHPVFVIHTTANKLAAPFEPINALGADETAFSQNVCQYDSALTAHCLALFAEGDVLYIKSGFHYWAASADYNGPTSWHTMALIYDGFYRYLKLDKAAFWQLYRDAMLAWENSGLQRRPKE